MKCCLVVLFFILVSVSAAHAVLPRDAEFRQKDVFNYRQRKLAEYEQAQFRHEILMVYTDRQIRQEMAVSPWGVSKGSAGAERADGLRADQHTAGAEQSFPKWTFSIIALLLIAGGTWWVKLATEGG